MFQSPESPESPGGSAPVQETSPASDDLETLLARRASPRQRALRVGLIALPLLIALVVVLFAFPGALPGSAEAGATATATAAAARRNAAVFNSLNTITVTSNLTFGALTLNGKRVRGRPPWQVVLARGKNTMTLTAPPFTPRTCTIQAPIPISSVPNSASLRESSGPGCTFGPSTGDATATMELAMPMSANDLPQALQRSALATVEWTLATAPGYTGTLPIGDYYATGLDANGLPITSRAAEPLTAQLSYSLADPATLPSGGFNGCSDVLCPGDAGQYAQIDDPIWIVDVMVAQDWRFTTPSGEVAAAVAETLLSPSVLGLSYEPGVGWRTSNAVSTLGSQPGVSAAAFPYADPCGPATRMLFSAIAQQQQAPSALPLSAAPGGPQGCKLQVTDQTTSPQATFVYVFGALLAADDGAHTFLPSLPAAPASEVAVLNMG